MLWHSSFKIQKDTKLALQAAKIPTNLHILCLGLCYPHLTPALLALVAQLDAPSNWRRGGRGFNPLRGRQHSFVEIDHEIFSMVILSLPLIQEGQLSVSGKRMCTVLVNRLEDYACSVMCG